MLARETGLSVKVLRLLAARSGGWTSMSEVARQLDLSRPYAGKLCKRLRDAGYLDTKLGVAGGIRLTEEARESTLYDVSVALQDPFVFSRCMLLRDACDPADPCPMHDAWERLHEDAMQVLRDCPVAPERLA